MDFKKTITLLAVMCAFSSFGQELIAPYNISSSDTVPSDEIWKVESILYGTMDDDGYLTMNGIQIKCLEYVYSLYTKNTQYTSPQSMAAAAGLDIHEMKLPFWLNSGDVIAVSSNVLYISVLRFTKPD